MTPRSGVMLIPWCGVRTLTILLSAYVPHKPTLLQSRGTLLKAAFPSAIVSTKCHFEIAVKAEYLVTAAFGHVRPRVQILIYSYRGRGVYVHERLRTTHKAWNFFQGKTILQVSGTYTVSQKICSETFVYIFDKRRGWGQDLDGLGMDVSQRDPGAHQRPRPEQPLHDEPSWILGNGSCVDRQWLC